MNKEIIRYSEAFKLQVVSELESGKFKCIFEARERYNIRGCGTIENWIKRYGKNNLLNKVVIVQTTEERDQLKAMKEENHKLKAALSFFNRYSNIFKITSSNLPSSFLVIDNKKSSSIVVLINTTLFYCFL